MNGGRQWCAAGAWLGITLTGSLAVMTTAQAQSYPSKPIRLVVASAAGGSTDNIARITGDRIAEAWGQQVVNDNRPGAGGILAAEIVARSAPDGHTLLLSTTAGIAVSGNLYRKLPYDAIRDFTPITLVATQPYILVAHPGVANTVQELVTRAKARPGEITFGSTGVGTSSHLTGEFLKSLAGIDILHVPYKSMSGVLVDVISGRVSISFSSPVAALTQVRAGKLKALAVTSAKRSTAAPDLPTMEEAGIKGYALENWYGLLGPAKLPARIVSQLHGVISKGLNQADVREKMARDGTGPVGSAPADFDTFIKAEIVKWAQLLKSAGIKPED